MALGNILTHKKASILEKWLNVLIETCPPDTSKYLKARGHKSENVIQSAISKGMEDIFDELLRDHEKGKRPEFLDNMVRVLAVQNFPPSKALSFFFSLKKIIRDEVGSVIAEQRLSQDILSLESAIDSLALAAFDVFMECREKIHEIKVNEAKRANFRLLQMANLMPAYAHKSAPAGEHNPIIKRGKVKQ